MFNQTSIGDFFPKKSINEQNNSQDLKEKETFSFFPSSKINSDVNKIDNITPLNSNEGFKNVFSDKSIIERVEVFTDGSTVNNGKKNASGGIGVFFNQEGFQNISEKYNSPNATNQKCELLAIVKGLQIIKSKFGRHSKKVNVLIHTDSEYCIKCMTSYISNWIRNNWKLRNGNNVKNKNLLELLLNLTHEFNNISYNHIRSHKQEPSNKESLEYKLWYGNMMADKFANEGRIKNYFK